MLDWGTLASIATAIGIFIGIFELRANWKLSQTEFEGSLDQQYREHLKKVIL